MNSARVRVVKGSCWSCKKRRVKCDLGKPVCQKCALVGATCDFNTRLIRWSTRPTVKVPARFQMAGCEERFASSLAVHEQRALEYFRGRLWPLLTTDDPVPPNSIAFRHRVVLLSACVLADTHRLLQGGRNSPHELTVKRVEFFTILRHEVDGCFNGGDGPPLSLLFAVILLYLQGGFLEDTPSSALTSSHHSGVVAILDRLGGLTSIMSICQEPLQMLLSEFASADLTTAMLQGRSPSFHPDVWDTIDGGSVWWGRDPLNRCSLASVFKEISDMAFYLDAMTKNGESFSADRIRAFEAALHPRFAPLTTKDLGRITDGTDEMDGDLEASHAFALIRSFQHTALIYLYRAICGLPLHHPVVQQHVQSCLDCILDITSPSKVLHCTIFPLFVAAAHTDSVRHQRKVSNLINILYDEMRFSAVKAVHHVLNKTWKSQTENITWLELFAELSPHIVVL